MTTTLIPKIGAVGTLAQVQTNADGSTSLVLTRDLTARAVIGSVLLRYIDSGNYTSGGGTGGPGNIVAQTITKAAARASTPYNYLKWNELVHDDTGDTAAIYPATATDRIIVPAGARLARVNASFASNPSSSASVSVTGAANNGSGAIRLTVSSAADFATGNSVTVSSVVGTTEANASWCITKIDATHVDLVGSTFTNAYVSGGTMAGSVPSYIGLRVYGGAAGTTNLGNTKLFSFHPTQSNNIANASAWFPVTPGDILRIALLQDTAADWVDPIGDTASSYFGAEFMA